MGDWNFADVFEVVAQQLPDAPCQVQGDRTVTWGEFDRRANGLARHLVDAGLQQQSKVAAYLYNGPEYLEVYVGAWKAGMAPVNTNFRYGPEEIRYLFENADAECVVFHTSFTSLLEKVRGELPQVKTWLAIEDGEPIPTWATSYDDVVAAGIAEPVQGPWGRSGDDLLLLYTGGTTGMPKGVMWRQDDLFMVLGGGGNPIVGTPPCADLEELRSRLLGPGLTMLPACPLMHGTGQFSAFITMIGGGCIVTDDERSFDPAHLWQTLANKKVNSLVIVGDAFARPLLGALDADPGAFDLSSLLLISSSGVMWSHETKEGILRHLPTVILFDSLGSSEAVGLATSTSTAGAAQETAAFKVGEKVKVFTEEGKEVQPGSDEIGMVSVTGYIPLGYSKDPEKSAKTFRTFDGVRYSTPGDFAQVLEDGAIHLLGRGSVCINTGGEKVFPEEVEEVLKEHASVRDAVCVGLPDDRFGETICALVEASDGATPDQDELIEHVRSKLARYKAPRRVLIVDTIGRSPAGKVDYKGLRQRALDTV